MEKTYWLDRRRSAAAMARTAATAQARLIHYDLAGRYSIQAAQCLPFMIPPSAPASQSEQAALHIPARPDQPHGPIFVGDPNGTERERR